MKKIYTIIITILGFSLLPSCDYLDIMPDEVPSEKEAFADIEAARRYLYSCYSFIPNPREASFSMDLWTSDENVTAFEHEAFAAFPKGNYTAVNVSDKNNSLYKMSLWNGLFAGIRQCYLLLENIDGVPGMDPAEKQLYKAETTFLIAYYHFLLLRGYGPTILVESLPDINEPNPENYLPRRPYDECVDWIAGKFDEAIAMGLKNSYEGSDYGRATATAAKALKGRMFLYAASPLFNGGSSSEPDTDNLSAEYANFKNADGTQLISTTYDASKWKRAADALEIAITAAKNEGIVLYNKVPDNLIAAPTDPVQATLRMTFADRNTREIIWPWCKKEDGYSVQNKSTPFDKDRDWSWNGIAPSIEIVKTFYTKNGLPIDEDPDYDYSAIEGTSSHGGSNIGNGTGVTLNLNLNREPRFYAWIAYHNSYYEIKRTSSTNTYLVKFAFNDNCGKNGRSTNYSPTGYLNKKGVHPNYRQGSGGGGLVHYPWPMIRLAEVYLNCAEALIEVGDPGSLAKAKGYIDEIRLRAGLKTLDETWAGIATLDQAKLRKIVRQERSIELYMENHRFWDVRRWLLGTKYFNARPMGMAVNEADEAAFLKIVDVGTAFERKFLTPQHYLMPIPIDDINRNPNIVQNPKY